MDVQKELTKELKDRGGIGEIVLSNGEYHVFIEGELRTCDGMVGHLNALTITYRVLRQINQTPFNKAHDLIAWYLLRHMPVGSIGKAQQVKIEARLEQNELSYDTLFTLLTGCSCTIYKTLGPNKRCSRFDANCKNCMKAYIDNDTKDARLICE